jgi:hypothetical protein
VEDDLINGTNITGVNPTSAKIIPNQGGGAHNWGIPLIIQDKSFVPKDVAWQDSKWSSAWGTEGDLWFPHIYEPNQSLIDPSGMNPYGRWDFGPWVQPNILAPVEVTAPEIKAALPLPSPADANNPQNYPTSVVPESFMDVMMVNGTLYPYLTVQRQAYRFRILNACNDRFVNLQLYLDASGGGSGATATAIITWPPEVCRGDVPTNGTGYVRPPGINIPAAAVRGHAAQPRKRGSLALSLPTPAVVIPPLLPSPLAPKRKSAWFRRPRMDAIPPGRRTAGMAACRIRSARDPSSSRLAPKAASCRR